MEYNISHIFNCEGPLEETYDINKITSWIQKLDVKKIALQFPDELLKDAPDVALKLKLASDIEIHILGDTTYGRYDFFVFSFF